MNKSAALRTKSKIKTKHTELIRSPVFYELSHHLANEKKIRILDLGKAQPGSVSFFNQYDCLYHILDIYPILSECKQAKKEPDQEFKKRISRLFGDLLAFDEQVQFDLVLFWDGLNYLDRKVLTLFMEYLLKHSHRHTFYHCYIYGHQNIPLHWGGFDILSDEHVLATYPDQRTVKGPAYSQADLKKMMPFVRINKSMLLKTGMLEYWCQLQ